MNLLTKEQLCAALNVHSTRMIDELVRKRKIPVIRLGHRTVRFDLAKVIAALEKLEIKAVGQK
jgi:excisionase family DNA binding protein